MMMRILKTVLILVMAGWLMILEKTTWADPPSGPPGVPGGNHGAAGDQYPAPIDGGLGFLLVMGVVYGIRRSRQMRSPNDRKDQGVS